MSVEGKRWRAAGVQRRGRYKKDAGHGCGDREKAHMCSPREKEMKSRREHWRRSSQQIPEWVMARVGPAGIGTSAGGKQEEGVEGDRA